jgi:chaperonin cofactor prefoldin
MMNFDTKELQGQIKEVLNQVQQLRTEIPKQIDILPEGEEKQNLKIKLEEANKEFDEIQKRTKDILNSF